MSPYFFKITCRSCPGTETIFELECERGRGCDDYGFLPEFPDWEDLCIDCKKKKKEEERKLRCLKKSLNLP